MRELWGNDARKWLIRKSPHTQEWIVFPSVGSFYGVITFRPDYESARADFIRGKRGDRSVRTRQYACGRDHGVTGGADPVQSSHRHSG
ncbi:hypothetical protein SEA_OHNO789_41 [Mycobacterium phage Ohno789]|nr:hypothetical protein SEA_OHNO789_41 [Mycobacterium phage Ohno789]